MSDEVSDRYFSALDDARTAERLDALCAAQCRVCGFAAVPLDRYGEPVNTWVTDEAGYERARIICAACLREVWCQGCQQHDVTTDRATCQRCRAEGGSRA